MAFGAGKTVLQHMEAKNADVDIVIVAACGERAGEVVEVLDETNETWWYILYLKTTGYMMREFLREQDG